MADVWLTADTHYGHSNICYGVSKWKDKENTRKFDTLEEMNQTIVDNINKYVKPDDILFHLGDWSFGGIDNIWNFRKQLNVKSIILILGNHDHHIERNSLINCDGKDIEAQRLFITLLPQAFKTKHELVLSHYPIESWENAEHGSIMVHGHVHGKLNDSDTNMFYRRIDVGIDWEEFRPYHIEEILELKKRPKLNRHE